MPRSDWRVLIAAIIGLGTLGTTYGYYQIEQATRPRDPGYNYQPARNARLPPAMVAGKPKAKPYQPYCQQPQTQGDSDLCAQWSAVKTVDESNRLVRFGILLSFILGGLGIVATSVGTLLVYRSLRQSDAAIAEAKLANKGANNTAERQLRAYVGIRSISLTEMNDIFDDCEIVVMWHNTGSTPAFNVIDFKGTTLDNPYIDDEFDFPELPGPGIVTIAPGQTTTTVIRGVNAAKIYEAQRRGAAYFVWASIEYSDIFPGSPRRRSECAYEVRFQVHGTIAKFIPLDRHSGMDYNCFKQPVPIEDRLAARGTEK